MTVNLPYNQQINADTALLFSKSPVVLGLLANSKVSNPGAGYLPNRYVAK